MELLLVGAIAGGASGALGYFTASKFHQKDLVERIYPIYSLIFFVALVVGARITLLEEITKLK